MTPVTGDDELVERTLDLFDLVKFWEMFVSLSNSIEIFCVLYPLFEMNNVTRL